MSIIDPISEIKLLVRSHHGLISINSDDERRIEFLLKRLSDQLNIPYFKWTVTKGLVREGEKQPVYNTLKPQHALDHIETSRYPGIYHMKGMEGYVEDKIISQKLKDTAKVYSDIQGALFLSGSDMDYPSTIKHFVAHYNLPHPTEKEYQNLVLRISRDLSKRMHLKVQINKKEAAQLIRNLRGLSLMETEKILTRVMVEEGKLSAKVISSVLKAKAAMIGKNGLLEYYPVENIHTEIADLKGLKTWLNKRKHIIVNPSKAKEFGLSFPKGLLLLGVQGCGKSLCAKAVAMEWKLPLLKFDPSNLYNKYMGESEKNFKRAVKVAEKMSPVVLWIDEIEKAFSQGGSSEDGGVSTRILGTFLTWLQERKGDVFIIATANNIEKLPPEFLRKGRFDEIFFVDLPNEEARWAIFEIHLKRKKRNPRKFDLTSLVKATKGFSGAEIEQVIISGLYSAFSENTALNTGLLMKEISLTRPLSQTMREKINKLRAWAKSRTVSAH